MRRSDALRQIRSAIGAAVQVLGIRAADHAVAGSGSPGDSRPRGPALAGSTPPASRPFPGLDELRSHVLVRGQGYGILLPQPCEFSEQEKGALHPHRLVAPLFPLNARAGVDHELVRAGRVGHTLWVPRWTGRGPQDYFADLRLTASVDAAFLTRDTRVAALSRAAWLAMADRLSRYFIGIPVDVNAFSLGQGGLHPDST